MRGLLLFFVGSALIAATFLLGLVKLNVGPFVAGDMQILLVNTWLTIGYRNAIIFDVRLDQLLIAATMLAGGIVLVVYRPREPRGFEVEKVEVRSIAKDGVA